MVPENIGDLENVTGHDPGLNFSTHQNGFRIGLLWYGPDALLGQAFGAAYVDFVLIDKSLTPLLVILAYHNKGLSHAYKRCLGGVDFIA